MEELDGMTVELKQLFAAKEERRRELARLPFPQKVEAVVKLQEMAAAILRARGKIVRPWQIKPVPGKVA
jgi:hypothetical protein